MLPGQVYIFANVEIEKAMCVPYISDVPYMKKIITRK